MKYKLIYLVLGLLLGMNIFSQSDSIIIKKYNNNIGIQFDRVFSNPISDFYSYNRCPLRYSISYTHRVMPNSFVGGEFSQYITKDPIIGTYNIFSILFHSELNKLENFRPFCEASVGYRLIYISPKNQFLDYLPRTEFRHSYSLSFTPGFRAYFIKKRISTDLFFKLVYPANAGMHNYELGYKLNVFF